MLRGVSSGPAARFVGWHRACSRVRPWPRRRSEGSLAPGASHKRDPPGTDEEDTRMLMLTLIALLVAVWLGWVGQNGRTERGLVVHPFVFSPGLTVPLAANASAMFIVLSVPRAGQVLPPSEYWWTMCAAVLGSILVLCLFHRLGVRYLSSPHTYPNQPHPLLSS